MFDVPGVVQQDQAAILRRTLFAGGGAGAGGEEGVCPIYSATVRAVGAVAGIGDWICHWKTSGAVLAWVDGAVARPVADVLGCEGKIG
jgi:hypothetical protein